MSQRGEKSQSQVTGNAGLYYVLFRLSQQGWNAMPTSRNAKGVDSLIYNHNATVARSIQIKSLSKRSPVPLGNHLDNLIGDFFIVCRRVLTEIPECFILTPTEVKALAHRGEKEGRVSFWLQPKEYEQEQFKEAWGRITGA